ncbi:MAG: DUF4337 domain-containing protein [Leptospira sp.]|nr:DUF4337 domain-containing protein [Leptospira sp.]
MSETEEEKPKNHRSEIVFGLTLSLFAAILAITDLGGGKFGDDEIIAINEKAAQYNWFQSKSVKQSLTEGQIEMLQTFTKAGVIRPEFKESISRIEKQFNEEVSRYKKEKKEILLGSSKVGKENWVQETDGKLGMIIGAKEWEEKTKVLGDAGDIFDGAVLFLQLSIVLGAIGLIIQNEKFRWVFFVVMVVLGSIGGVYSGIAFSKALAI